MSELTNQNEYKNFITEVAIKIKQTQTKLAVTVNSGLILFYYELGGMISHKQKQTKWGSKFIENRSNERVQPSVG